MKKMTGGVLTAISLILWARGVLSVDFQLQPYSKTSGIYYNDLGTAQLYDTAWKLVTYVNITKLDNEGRMIQKYVRKTEQMCKELQSQSINACLGDIEMIQSRVKGMQEARELLRQITRTDNQNQDGKRIKRGIFNFIGQASKFLFGTLDEDDAIQYQNKISQLEQEQLGMLKVAHEQMTVVKSTLQTINSTLYKVSQNEQMLQETLRDMQNFINNETKEIQVLFRETTLEVMINRHFIELESCITQVKERYRILITAVMNAQQGLLQPEILSPVSIMKAFQRSQSNFPKELTLPVSLNMAQGHVLLKLSEISIFIRDDVLCYVIETPLVNGMLYNVYQLIPFPTLVEKSLSDYIFIDSVKDILMIDETKQMYVMINEGDLGKCKVHAENKRICKQEFPLMYTRTHEECAIQLMVSNSIPKECVKRIIRVNELKWIAIKNKNKWIYVAPRPETVTVMCSKSDPTETTIEGVGILTFYDACQCYGSKTKVVSQSVIKSNRSSRDFVPDIILSYDCCEHLETGITLEQLDLSKNGLLLNTLSNINDLKYASHKVDEVEEMISEKESEIKQNKSIYYTNVLSYIGTGFVLLILLCCCCKCCKCCKPVRKYWYEKGEDCCTKLCLYQNIVSTHDYNDRNVRVRPPIERHRRSVERSSSLLSLPEMTQVSEEIPINGEEIELTERVISRTPARQGKRY